MLIETQPKGHLLVNGRLIESRQFEADAGFVLAVERGKLVTLFPPTELPEGEPPNLVFSEIDDPKTNRTLNSAMALGKKLEQEGKTPKEVADEISRFLHENAPELTTRRGQRWDLVTVTFENQTEAYSGYLIYLDPNLTLS